MTQVSTLSDLAAETVSAVLGAPPAAVRAADSLFELPGFDSLAVVAVLDRLESALGVEVPADLIVPEAFESVDALTELLARATGGRP